MKNIALGVLVVLGLAVAPVRADNSTLDTPKSEKGGEVDPLYGGWKYARVASTSESLICTGRCAIGGVYMSTGANSTRLRVRDTITADNTTVMTTNILPPMPFSQDQTTARGNKVDRAPRSNNGLAASLSSVSAGEEVIILYIDL